MVSRRQLVGFLPSVAVQKCDMNSLTFYIESEFGFVPLEQNGWVQILTVTVVRVQSNEYWERLKVSRL